MQKYEKFLALDDDKKTRIINASMQEFLAGYKKASTDNIVREAKISKGALFHYFGTKEQLYAFLIDYSMDIIKCEFLDLADDLIQSDILQSIWQLSLVKKELSVRFPAIFDFITSAYLDGALPPSPELEALGKIRDSVFEGIYTRADFSLFREDIEPKIIIEIISYTMQGYVQSVTAEAVAGASEHHGARVRKGYDAYLGEFERVLNALRLVFYREGNR
ncbi:MAG: TetR/AcrR family transcriptional regulator [Defluviitaleaceae bacterium]|nr:TetR/AcrR family transcriptional regulator [Defluviitaleaceae bacterium]